MVNAKSIKIVKIPKFASNLDVAFVIVLMHAQNSVVDQTLYVFQVIIDRHVFAVMVLLEIQMISVRDVNRLVNVLKFQIFVKRIPIVKMVIFALLEQMELEIVLTHVFRSLVVQMKNAN